MSRVDNLIEKLAPGGVPFMKVADICTVFNGFAFKSEYFNLSGDGLPLIRIRDVNTGFSETYYSGEYDPRWIVENGDIVIGMDGDFRATKWRHGRALLNQRVCRLQDLSDQVLPSYVRYKIQDVLDKIHESTAGSTVKHLSSKQLERARLPVPPLELQREIVSILDQFTDLEAELEAELNTELEARLRQYEHYRQVVLEEAALGVGLKALGELGRIVTGRTPRSSESAAWGGSLDFVTPSDIKNGEREVSATVRSLSDAGAASMVHVQIPARSLLVTCIGADMGKTVVSARPCVTNQQINSIVPNSLVDVGYMFHVLSSMREQLRVRGGEGGGTMPLINKSAFSAIEVPVPNLEVQRSAAEKLDAFESLQRGLRACLREELTARRKQYEYYRDKLLTFEEAPA